MSKNAFGEINVEAIVTEDVEEGTKMLKMRRVDSKQFPIKSGITLLCGG